MKINFFIKAFVILFSFFLLACSNENSEEIMTGKRTKHYKDGSYLEYDVVNGIAQGEWKLFYKDGQLKRLSYFENNKRTGLVKEFDSIGKLREEFYCLDGKANGPSKTYDENKNLIETETNINGEANGIWITYYPNGKMQSYSIIFNAKEKLRTEFDETGKPTYERFEYIKVNHLDTIDGNTELSIEFKMINGKQLHKGIKDFTFKYGDLYEDGTMNNLVQTYNAIGDSIIKITVKPKNKGYNVFTGLLEYQSIFGDTSNLVSVPYKGLFYAR
ncbi:MAG: hypothetical protein ABI388_10190 [Bacteroidia bacterium]